MSAIPAAHLDTARRFLHGNPPPGRVLLCAVTGSHTYGFTSPDSDIDLKGIHLAPTEMLLGLSHPQETHDRLTVFEGIECDLTTHEVGKALSWMLRGNGNMLERLLSPIQLVQSAELEALQGLARGALSQLSYSHYAGFFKGMQRESLRQSAPRAKTLLYSYRVALTGAHLLRTGTLLTDLPTLAEHHGFPEVEALIARKRAGAEKEVLPAADAARYQAAWPRLEVLLKESLAESVLPPRPQNTAACEGWLVELRRQELR